MIQFEITYITKEEDKQEIVPKLIEKFGGKVRDSQNLGQKKFIYPIKKETVGYYTTLYFELAPDRILDLNKELSLQSEVLRHLLLVKEAAKIVPKVSPKVEEAIEEAIAKTKKVPKAVKVQAKEGVVPEIKETKEDEKKRMKKLEESLEEILKE